MVSRILDSVCHICIRNRYTCQFVFNICFRYNVFLCMVRMYHRRVRKLNASDKAEKLPGF